MAALLGKMGKGAKQAGAESSSMGLAQVLAMKKFANNTASKERVIDECQWRKNVVDMHRVMKMTQNLFLILEQSNEAMLRLGVEIVTCRQSRKCIWWPDHWNEEDDMREQFRETLDEKLKVVICYLRQRPPTPKDKSEVQSLQKSIVEATKERKDAKDALETANQKVRDLEAELQALREQDEDADEEGAKKSAELLAAARAEIRALKADIKQRCAAPPGVAKAGLQELEGEAMQAAERRSAYCQTDVEWDHEDLQRPSAVLAAPAPVAPSAAEEARLHDRSEDLMRIASLEQQLQRAEQRISEGVGQPAAAPNAEAEAAELEALQKAREATSAAEAASAAELKALQDLMAAQEDKLKCEVEQKRMQDEIRQLEKDKFEMLETMSTLKANIDRLKSIGEAKGINVALMEQILAESDVSRTVSSKKFSCFLRLYQDALRRIEQRQKAEKLLLGDVDPQTNLRLFRQAPVHVVLGLDPFDIPQLRTVAVASPAGSPLRARSKDPSVPEAALAPAVPPTMEELEAPLQRLKRGSPLPAPLAQGQRQAAAGLSKDSIGGGPRAPPAREPPARLQWRQPGAGELPGGGLMQALGGRPGLMTSLSAPSLPLAKLAPPRVGLKVAARWSPQAPGGPSPPRPARVRPFAG